jgi:hypothetical protein
MNQKVSRIGQILAAILIIAAFFGVTSCEKYSFAPPTVKLTDSVHFSADIQPIFSNKCLSCHGAIKAPDLRIGKAYQALIKGGFVNLPGNTSVLYTEMTGSDHAPRSSDIEKQKVLIWINQGAHNN